MKKFKSLMLAALASAALAAPSFADGHGGPNLGITGISGEVVYELQQSSTSPDEGNSTTVMDAEVGDVNISFNSDYYKFYFERDDEGSLDNRLKIVPSMKSGDNYVKAVGEIKGLFGDAGSDAGPYGDVFVEGGNKSIYVKVGTFGSTEYYGNGMGVSRASLGNGVDPDGVFKNGEHLVISDFKGVEVGINAGDIKFEVAVPWMNSGDSSAYALKSSKDQTVNGTVIAKGASVDSNITGIRPGIQFGSGDISVNAIAYSLSIQKQNSDIDVDDMTRSGAQIVGSFNAGSATIGAFYSSATEKDGSTDVTPTAGGANVTVALGSGQKVGASFDTSNNGQDNAAEVTSTRFSASYQMPFFVEALSLKLGVGTSTENSDTDTLAGSASSMEAEWAYTF
jgi:hypothetical protein